MPDLNDVSNVKVESQGKDLVKAAFGDSVWHAASFSKEMKDWNYSLGSADSDNLYELDTITGRARDAERNNARARAVVHTKADAINGVGLRPIPKPNWRVLGKSKQWADDWSAEVKSKAESYFNSTDVDATRIDSWGALSRTALLERMTAGGFIALPVYKPDSGQSIYGTAIQLVEIERLSNPMGLSDTATRRGGVEIDENGQPLGYWIRTTHPGDDFLMMGGGPAEWEFVPAATEWGRRRVIHSFQRDRIGANRGVSMLATLMPEFRIANRYERAELQTALANSLVAMVVQSNMPPEMVKSFFEDEETYLNFRRKFAPKLTAGSTVVLPPGESVQAFAPNRANSSFDDFLKSILRGAYASVGMPLEFAQKDFSQMNYSNARVALNEAWRSFATERSFETQRWATPTYQLWFEEAVHLGQIPDCTPDDLYRDENHFQAWQGVKWIGDGRGWVDPKKEAEAAGVRISLGLSTLEDEAAEQGRYWLDVLEQQDTERRAYQSRGLIYPGDNAAAKFSGGESPNPEHERAD